MIDKQQAIHELNTAIAFIPRNLIDSDMTIKQILEYQEQNAIFLSTEGEIATLLEDDNLNDLRMNLQIRIKSLKLKLSSMNKECDTAFVLGQINAIETILKELNQ